MYHRKRLSIDVKLARNINFYIVEKRIAIIKKVIIIKNNSITGGIEHRPASLLSVLVSDNWLMRKMLQ